MSTRFSALAFLTTSLLAAGLLGCGLPAAEDLVGATQEDLFVASTRIWKNRTISVCWEDTGTTRTTEKGWVEAAVRRTWEKESQLVFTFGDCGNANIRIKWSDEGPHTKGLGTQLDNVPSGMVLNPTFNNWATYCKTTRRSCIESIAVHEFGHALGFAHEQNRPDTPSTCAERQGSDGDSIVGAWDLSSVMNYCNPTWNNGGVLSGTDIEGLRIYYGQPKRADWQTRIVVESGVWGEWTPVAYCPSGSWGAGYSMRVEAPQGSGDDTGLNAVSLRCADRRGGTRGTAKAHDGYWGSWSIQAANCLKGQFLRGADLAQEAPQGSNDDTAANDVRFACTDGRTIAAAGGSPWGTFRGLALCPVGSAVCGISVRVEKPQGGGDDTAMNGLQLDCCRY